MLWVYMYVIVIFPLLFDMMHTVHETRGREHCVCIISSNEQAITVISPPPATSFGGNPIEDRQDELCSVLFLPL